MAKYEIEVEEVLQKVVKIEANSLEEALRIAQNQYYNEVISLHFNDLKEVNIREFK